MTKDEAKNHVNGFGKIGINIMYGYYGGDLSETDDEKIKSYVIDKVFASQEDSALTLSIESMESYFSDSKAGSEYDNSWKLFGLIYNRANANLFLDIHGGKNCEALCDINKGLDKVNEYVDVFNKLVTVINDVSDIHNASKALIDKSSTKAEYTDALVETLTATLDFSADIFGMIFDEYSTCLNVLNQICQYTIKGFVDVVNDRANILSLDEISATLEINGDSTLANKVYNLLNKDYELCSSRFDKYENPQEFINFINENYLSYDDLKAIYDMNIASSDDFTYAFKDYINWYMNQNLYAVLGGEDEFDDFMDKIEELESSKSISAEEVVKRGIEWWNEYIVAPAKDIADFWDEKVAEPGSEIIEDIVDRYNNKEDIFSVLKIKDYIHGSVMRDRTAISNVLDDISKISMESSDDKLSVAEKTVYDPLILDINGDGYDISSKKEGAYFDLNGDGFAEKINWTTTDAILAIDKNGNGNIDNGNEVFGDFFILENGKRAKNGFEALAQYDENGDGIIDVNDVVFSELLLWVDSNGNGSVDEGELSRLSDYGITYISLNYEEINGATDSEAVIGNESVFGYEDGSESKVGEMWVSSDLYDAMEKISIELADNVSGLPDVRSFGNVHSLHTAMALDETGRLRQLVESFVTETSRAGRLALVDEILEMLCHTEDIASDSRGGYIDAAHLAVIEAMLGKDFVGVDGKNPNRDAAAVLNQVYDKIADVYYFALLGSEVFEHIELIGERKDDNGNISYDLDIFNKYMVFGMKMGFIDESTFADVAAYLNYYSTAMLGDHSLYLEFRDFVDTYANEYIDMVDNAAYDAIIGTKDSDDLSGTSGDDLIFAGSGDDVISGESGNDLLFGEAGNDTIYGYSGNDILDGGAGDDILYGGYDNDTYIFGRGYGHDTIDEQNKNSLNDKVRFKDGITADDIEISREGDDMILTVRDTGDSLRIVKQYSSSYYRIETFEFADGTVAEVDLSKCEFNILVEGTSYEDTIQSTTDILNDLYADDSMTSEFLTETDNTVISDISDGVSVSNETDNISDQTDIQVMILTEQMSAFSDNKNVSQGINITDINSGVSEMDQLLVGSSI